MGEGVKVRYLVFGGVVLWAAGMIVHVAGVAALRVLGFVYPYPGMDAALAAAAFAGVTFLLAWLDGG